MIKLATVNNKLVKHTFLECDNCHLDIDCINSIEIGRVLELNNWITYKSKPDLGNQRVHEFPIPEHYCPKCANALEIKSNFVRGY